MAKRKTEDVPYFEGVHHDVAILGSAGISIAMENDQPANLRPGAKPSVVIPADQQYGSGFSDIMPWGDGNDFPQRIVDLYNKDSLLPATLGKVATIIQGAGVIAGLMGSDQTGKETFSPLPPSAVADEIFDFLESEHFKLYNQEISYDAAWFFNGWPELIVSKDRSRITQIHPLSAEECRWCRMTPSGELPHIYLSANWPRDNSAAQGVKQITAIDPYRPDNVDWLRDSTHYNAVYPLRYPTPGKRYYSLPHHYSLVESGWLDVHLAVPAFKKYLMQNQMTLKYHWKVDMKYWEELYGDLYTKGTPAKKRELKKKWLVEMTKSLTDTTQTGNSILTDTSWDQHSKIMREYITVTPIADLLKDAKYLEDHIEAASQIFYAANLDPTISGFQGGAKQGAQSGGSNKREAYLIAIQMYKPFRDMILAPLNFVARYNGWKTAIPKLGFRTRDTILTTLDTGAGTAKTLS